MRTRSRTYSPPRKTVTPFATCQPVGNRVVVETSDTVVYSPKFNERIDKQHADSTRRTVCFAATLLILLLLALGLERLYVNPLNRVMINLLRAAFSPAPVLSEPKTCTSMSTVLYRWASSVSVYTPIALFER